MQGDAVVASSGITSRLPSGESEKRPPLPEAYALRRPAAVGIDGVHLSQIQVLEEDSPSGAQMGW